MGEEQNVRILKEQVIKTPQDQVGITHIDG